MRINTNMNAMTALNQSTKNTALAGTSMNKISSGERITKAGDDAAGMAISEKMRSQIRGLDQAKRNTQDGVSVAQTAEGGMEEVGNIIQRMRELSVQSSNETNTGEDREKIVEELTQLHKEIDRIADSTQFNGKNLTNGTENLGTKTQVNLDTKDKFSIGGLESIKNLTEDDINLSTEDATNGTKITVEAGGKTFVLEDTNDGKSATELKAGTYTLTEDAGTAKITISIKEDQTVALTDEKIGTTEDVEIKGNKINLQVGANTTSDQQIEVQINSIKTADLGLKQTDIDAMKTEGVKGTFAAKDFINSLDNALSAVNTSKANIGAMQNRLETASSNLTTSSENLTSAESRIRDVDVADEMMTLSKLNLLTQASQAMMMQAKSQPEGVMQLLR